MSVSKKAEDFTNSFLGNFSKEAKYKMNSALDNVERLDGKGLFVVMNTNSGAVLSVTKDIKQASAIAGLWLLLSNIAYESKDSYYANFLSRSTADIAIGLWDESDKTLPAILDSADAGLTVDCRKFKVLFPFIGKGSVVFSEEFAGKAVVEEKFRIFGKGIWGSVSCKPGAVISPHEAVQYLLNLGIVISLSSVVSLSAVNSILADRGQSMNLRDLEEFILGRAIEESDEAASSVDLSGFTNGALFEEFFKRRSKFNPFK